MSLVSLSSVSDNIPFVSSSREPFNFTNHFPQPLIIEPDSEVCLTNITFSIPSGSSGYFIKGGDNPASTGGNNKLIFSFADAGYCGALDVAVLKTGEYTGDELAVEIARAMNEVNRFRYYTFSCVFVASNPAANPPTEDTFTISYTETGGSLETASGGTWGIDSLEVGDDTIITTAPHNHFGNGSVPYNPEKIACPDVPEDPDGNTTAFADSKGMVLYTQGTGLGEIGGCGFTDCTFHAFGDGSSATAAPRIEEKTFGIASPLQVGKSSEYFGSSLGTDETGFNKDAMEFKVETYVDAADANILQISYALPIAYDEPPTDTQVDNVILRTINLSGILTACTDVLLVRVVAVYRTRAYLVQLYKNDGADGEFSQVAFSTGGVNSSERFSDGTIDNNPKVYLETMNDTSNGVAPHPILFGGVVYSTLGVPTNVSVITPYGTGAGDARAAPSVLNNAYTQSIVCPIPVVSFKRNTEAGQPQNVITDFNLGSDAGDSPSTYQQNIQGLTTADNTYTIQFNNDTNNGYDGTISIAVAPLLTDDSEVPTTETNGLAYKKTTREITKWTLYQDNNTPQDVAASLGTITITPNSNSITITSTSFANGNPFLSTLVGDAPRLITEPIFAFVGLTENPVDNIMSKNDNQETFSRYDYYMPANSPDGDYEDDPADRVGGAQQASSGTARSNGGGGSFLDEVLCLRLGKITQEDLDEVGDGAFRRLGVEEVFKGSVGETIGFNKNTYQVDIPTRTITSDIKPYTDLILEKTLSVSLPELSNVKSLEGESSQRYKTIKVIPFDSFTRSDEIKSLVSYEAPYEDWIKINNGRETQVNQLTLQLRKPDGKLSDYVKGECRATIKFRESPEKRQERMFDRLAEKMTQKQNPGAEILVKANTFVGS